MTSELVTNENKDIVYSSFLLKRNGLEALGDPTLEQWLECGEFIKKAEGSVHFWIGDWLNYGEQTYGQMYTQALDHTEFDYGTLRDDKWIADRIPASLRSDNLDRGHAREIASLEEDVRKSWIDKTLKNEWSVAELRQHIKADKAKLAGFLSIQIRPALYGENIYFNSGEFSPIRFGDTIIKDNSYPTLARISRFFHSNGTEYSLREYARVQDFPDSFKFVGNYSSIKSQIGNAVSPLMAKFIGQKLKGKTFIDLFAGCGGLSLGLEETGKVAVYANEIEPAYFQTYIVNFPLVQVDINDIHNILTKDIPDADIVVGGPPCQGFSSAGLRLKDDPRNELYKEFLRIVEGKRPKEFLMENVPEIEQIKGQVLEDFLKIGYKTTFQIVKGEEIGMKQKRHRAFFIGRL